MKHIGIICEYNPFHYGHIYHLEQIKKQFNDCIIVLILSGYITQRGEFSLLSKEEKTRLSLEYGIDLIIELPSFYVLQSADYFAYASIFLLNELKIDTLVFGSESVDIASLTKLAKAQLKYDLSSQIKEKMKQGDNYPSTLSHLLYQKTGIKIDTPNDLLGICYIKEILKQEANITPIAIKRTNNYHDKIAKNGIMSASGIRSLFEKNEDIKPYIPPLTYEFLKQKRPKQIYPYFQYKVLTTPNLQSIKGIDPSLEQRIKINIKEKTEHEFLHKIKTKHYTFNRLKRAYLSILLGLEQQNQELYLRILGFNTKGRNYLHHIKKEINIPIITNYEKKWDNILSLEQKLFELYCFFIQETPKEEIIFPIIKKEE